MSEDDLYNEMVLFSHKASDVDQEVPMEKKKVETFSVFIGNLTWWTTDQDLMDLVAGVGVTDVVDILIHENAPNGLSKGYATVTVESMVSLHLMMNKLSNRIVHNKLVTVDSFTIANQTKYENAFKEMIAKTSKVNSIKSESSDGYLNPSINRPTIQAFPASTGTGAVPRNIIPQPVLIPPPMLSVPPPLLYTVLNPGQPLPHHINPGQTHPHQIRYPVIMNNPPPPYLPPSQHIPQPINQKAVVMQNAAVYKGKMLTKEEFEEVFTLNKKVAEQSMKRASADAEAGNYSEAIETLVTAISLIKESKLGMDTQGVALMKPLQDLLLDIETDSIKAKQKMNIMSEKSPVSLHNNNNKHLNDRDDRRNDHDDRRDNHDVRRDFHDDPRDIRGDRRDDLDDRRDDHDDRRDDRDDRRDDRIRKMSIPLHERRRVSRSPQRFRRRSRSPLLEERYSPMRFVPSRDIGHRGNSRDGRMRDERDYSRRFDRNYKRRF